MYTDNDVKRAYKMSKGELIAAVERAERQRGRRNLDGYGHWSKDEVIGLWLDLYANHECGILCAIHGDVRDTSAVRA